MMLRDLAPKSLFGRTILIVVLPLFIMQAVITWVFFNRHWEEVTGALTKNTARDIGYLTDQWQTAKSPIAQALLIQDGKEFLGMDIGFVENGAIPATSQDAIFNALNRSLDRELDWSLRVPFWYDATGFDDAVEIRVQLETGYLVFMVDREQVVARNGHFFVLWLMGTTILLGYIALIFLRNQVRSITRLAAAAEAFGRGQDVRNFKPSGAREVRQAGHAFLAMRARIRRFVVQRTEMLAGVSHDLKTPLTRMKLNLALQPQTEDLDDMKADISEMERLLDDYLIFARGEAKSESELVSLNALGVALERRAARQDRELTVEIPEGTVVLGQLTSLERALTNLIENAFKFGTKVSLSALRTGTTMDLRVDDDGPGIPTESRQEAVTAFERLDDARNSNMPGSGLGLAIVRDVARAHGGHLRLESSPLGGLRAVISIPMDHSMSPDGELSEPPDSDDAE